MTMANETTTTTMTSSADDIMPSWALDPLTNDIMTCPVTISAPCHHVMDKSTFVEWVKHRDNDTVCPVCLTPLTQIVAHKNRDLARKIHLLQNRNDPDNGDISFHPEMDLQLSSSALHSNNTTNNSKLSLDPRTRLSQEEHFLDLTCGTKNPPPPADEQDHATSNADAEESDDTSDSGRVRHSSRTAKTSNKRSTSQSRSPSPLRYAHHHSKLSNPPATARVPSPLAHWSPSNSKSTRILASIRPKHTASGSPPRVIKTSSPRTLQRLNTGSPVAPRLRNASPNASTSTANPPPAATTLQLLEQLRDKVLPTAFHSSSPQHKHQQQREPKKNWNHKVPVLKTTRNKDLLAAQSANVLCS